MKKGTFTPISERKNRDLSKHDGLSLKKTPIRKISLSLMIGKALYPGSQG